MRILQMCNDMFGQSPKRSVKAFFHEMRVIENAKTDKGEDNTDRGFFMFCSQWLGGRGYNEYLDYGLFALKLNKIFDDTHSVCQGQWKGMREAISNLLHDDRHDMYQNIPYELDDYVKGFKKPEDVAKFWTDVVDAMIDCINVRGTGDVAHNFVIKED